MRYVALVEYSSKEVDENGDYADDGEYCCWSGALLCGLGGDAGFFGEDFEGVGAFIRVNADERYEWGGGEGIFVAVEGDGG